jgi:hypothetical protein
VNFVQWLDVLRAKGVNVIVVAHNETKTVDDPDVGSTYQLHRSCTSGPTRRCWSEPTWRGASL